MRQEFFLNQLKAGENVAFAVEDFFKNHSEKNVGLENLRYQDAKSLARKICLATVSCSAVNCLLDKKIFTDTKEDGSFTVGDFFRIVLPWHKIEPTGMSPPYDMGWRVADAFGNIYHHAVAAFLSIFDIRTYSLRDFSGIDWLYKSLKDKNVVLALSLDNSFLIEQSLSSEDKDFLASIYSDFGTQAGRHVVTVFDFKNDLVSLIDSFQVLKPKENPKKLNLDFSSIDKYFHYRFPGPTQALVFSFDELAFPKENLKDIFIPDYVKKDIEVLKKRFLEINRL